LGGVDKRKGGGEEPLRLLREILEHLSRVGYSGPNRTEGAGRERETIPDTRGRKKARVLARLTKLEFGFRKLRNGHSLMDGGTKMFNGKCAKDRWHSASTRKSNIRDTERMTQRRRRRDAPPGSHENP